MIGMASLPALLDAGPNMAAGNLDDGREASGDGIAWLVALAAALVGLVGGALLAAKMLLPWPRPRISCQHEITPPGVLEGSLSLHTPDVQVTARALHGTPSVLGELTFDAER